MLLAAGLAVGWSWRAFSPLVGVATAAAVLLSLTTRLIEAVRFRTSLASSFAHPLAILLFLGIQWFGLIRRAAGLKATWKGRSLTPQ